MKYLDNQTVDTLVRFRHDLHRIAEVSGEERNTARKVRTFLEEQRPDSLKEHIGGYGLAATWHGEQEGPSIMIRCELDALPIPEENDLDYRSQSGGVSHKCGHDGHMAVVAGIATVLSNSGLSKGSVHLLFQPSEETGQGAERVLGDKKFEALAPDYIFALHNLPGFPENQIIVNDGIFCAASRGLVVELKGATSHAAHPEQGNSPAHALAQLIQTFSSFPQNLVSIDEAAKVTVIHSRLGEIAFGTTPGEAEFRVTIRSYRNSVMQRLCERAEQVVNGIAHTHQLEVDMEWVEIFEATENDSRCNEFIRQAAHNNGFKTITRETPFAWSEDFGRFTSKYIGAMFGLGAGSNHPRLHESDYDFPDECIPAGTAMFLDIIDQIAGLKI